MIIIVEVVIGGIQSAIREKREQAFRKNRMGRLPLFSADSRLLLCHTLFQKNEHTASDVLTSLCVPVLPFITNLVTLPLYAGL